MSTRRSLSAYILILCTTVRGTCTHTPQCDTDHVCSRTIQYSAANPARPICLEGLQFRGSNPTRPFGVIQFKLHRR
ncbi:hypothetical protein OH77DRAFT_171006 [Trametes cingulata]|nr:hypothetical protein OH77DRAFT_171006 [Trametes cingulata]